MLHEVIQCTREPNRQLSLTPELLIESTIYIKFMESRLQMSAMLSRVYRLRDRMCGSWA